MNILAKDRYGIGHLQEGGSMANLQARNSSEAPAKSLACTGAWSRVRTLPSILREGSMESAKFPV